MDSRIILQDFLINHGLERVFSSNLILKEFQVIDKQGIEVYEALSNQYRSRVCKVLENSNTQFSPIVPEDFRVSNHENGSPSCDLRYLYQLFRGFRSLREKVCYQLASLQENIGVQIVTIKGKIQSIGKTETVESMNFSQDDFYKLLSGLLRRETKDLSVIHLQKEDNHSLPPISKCRKSS